MAKYEGRSILLDDGTRIPADNNGVPYPAHIAAENPSLASSPEIDTDDSSKDEDDTDADYVDDFGYVHNPKSDDLKSYSTTLGALREAGVRFDRTTWVKISAGSLEFSINLAKD